MDLSGEWYESAIASFFTLEMGYRNGQRGERHAQTLLMHQSPLDTFFGDAANRVGSRFFLVEFKKDVLAVTSENDKPLRRALRDDLAGGVIAALQNEAAASGGGPEPPVERSHSDSQISLAELSLRGHFLCWGRRRGGRARLEVESYARWVAEMPKSHRWSSVEDFFDAIESDRRSPDDEAHGPGLRLADFTAYMSYLVALAILEKEKDASDGSAASTARFTSSYMVLGTASEAGLGGLPIRGADMLFHLLQADPDMTGEISRAVAMIRSRRAEAVHQPTRTAAHKPSSTRRGGR